MDILKRQLEAANLGKPYAVIVVVETDGRTAYEVGKRILLLEDGTKYGTVGGGMLEMEILKDATDALQKRQSYFKEYINIPDYEDEGLGCHFSVKIFVEIYNPAPHLIICGGGHVGNKVMQIAKFLSFETTLVDIRTAEELGDTLQYADKYVHCEEYEKGVLDANIPDGAYFVLGASTHTQDKAALKGALQRNFKYIGMLGNLGKTQDIFPQLVSEGFSQELLEQVHTPIGLDIADFSPEQIAIAIISEILLVKNGKTLRHRGEAKFQF